MRPDTAEPNDASAALVVVASRAAEQAADENFPVAFRLLPGRIRAQLARVYAFARFVDDVGDDAPGDRAVLLAQIEAQVRRLGEPIPTLAPTLAPVAGLVPVVGAGVPVQLFLDLVAANVRDQHTTRYPTFDDLLDYCRLSAAPVGRIVLHLANAADAANCADSDAVCNALQVLEHCQDVGEDARAGRIYLPAAELRAAGVADAELTRSATTPALRSVVATQVERSAQLLRAGRPLVRRQRGWARLAVAGYVAGGLATADALRRNDYDVLTQDIRPSKARTAFYALRLLLARRG